jgi:hypothetical protein
MKIFQWLSLIAFLLTTAINVQAASYNQQSITLLDQQTEDINKTIQLIVQHEATLGNEVADLSYTISLPSQTIVELGLVLDFKDSDKGFKVLSVTPGSYADKLSIKRNDYIVKINGKAIHSSSTLALKPLFQQPEKITELAFKSAGIYQEVVVKLEALYLPEANLTIGQDNLSAQSLEQLEQLKHRIQGTLWTMAENEKKLGHDMRQFSYSADIPSKILLDLGLIIGLESESMGFRVLDILAGSNAKSLGLEKGDLIISINHLYVLHASTNNLMNVLRNLTAEQAVTLGILISGTEHFITTKVRSLSMPSINFTVGNADVYSPFIYQLKNTALPIQQGSKDIVKDEDSCGIVSMFKVLETYASPGSVIGRKRDPYFSSIDDNIKISNKHSYVLPVGKHAIEITRRNKGFRAIEVDVQANKKYELSYFVFSKEKASQARLLSLGISNKYREPNFWLPFVRQEVDKTCSL